MKSACVEDLRIAIDICENYVSRAKIGCTNVTSYGSVGRIYVALTMIR